MTFGGPAFFIDRSDINTDEIIPAKYLTEISKQALKPHLLEDLHLADTLFEPHSPELKAANVLITRSNFGCGSSREHAVWALEVNDIKIVIASGFARIFRQNMFNCGLLPVELSVQEIEEIFSAFSGTEAECSVDLDSLCITVTSGTDTKEYDFSLSDFHKDMIASGGWVEYANSKY